MTWNKKYTLILYYIFFCLVVFLGIYGFNKYESYRNSAEELLEQEYHTRLYLSETLRPQTLQRIIQLQDEIKNIKQTKTVSVDILNYFTFVSVKLKDIINLKNIDIFINKNDIEFIKKIRNHIDNDIIPAIDNNELSDKILKSESDLNNIYNIIYYLSTEKNNSIYQLTELNVQLFRYLFISSISIAIFFIIITGFFLYQKRNIAEKQQQFVHSFSNLFAHATAPRITIVRSFIENSRNLGHLPKESVVNSALNAITPIETITKDLLTHTKSLPCPRIEMLEPLVKSLIQENENIITIDMPPEVAKLGVPAAELCLILDELIRNALEAAQGQDHPEIILSSRLDKTTPLQKKIFFLPDRLILEVEDNGKGMSQDTIKKATHHFFSTKGGSHLGLGLSNCLQLLSFIGGTIEIKSTLGKGTNIKIMFPIILEGEPPTAA